MANNQTEVLKKTDTKDGIRAAAPKRVLCLLSNYAGNGGIHRFNRNLVEAIRQQPGAVCTVLTLNDAGAVGPYRGAGGSKALFLARILWQFLSGKPDLLVVGLLNFAPLALFGRMSTGVRTVCILHGFEAWYRRGNLAPFYRYIDAFWAVSQYTRQTFSRTNGVASDRVAPIFNTIPSDWDGGSVPLRREPYFLSITRLDKGEGYKGIDKSIQAIGRLQDRMRALGWEYRLIAHGDDLERHRRLAADLGVSDLVRIRSGVTDEELKALYAQCGFFLLPSSGEGFGIVFLEAMAYRKACIGSLGCGTTDVISHGVSGFLIDPTPDTIEDAVSRLMEDPERCAEMGEAGYRRLQDTFSFPRFAARIAELT
ncbi:MAG: hypothetical protein RLY31_903 [Bacteroidota bacterium]